MYPRVRKGGLLTVKEKRKGYSEKKEYPVEEGEKSLHRGKKMERIPSSQSR